MLLVLLLVPLISFAEDQDPIIGTWYVYTGPLENYHAYLEFNIFHFKPDGTIFNSQYDLDENGVTTTKDFKTVGLWTKENDIYFINFAMQGPHETTIENNTMFIPVSTEYMIRVKRMDPINYTLDIKLP